MGELEQLIITEDPYLQGFHLWFFVLLKVKARAAGESGLRSLNLFPSSDLNCLLITTTVFMDGSSEYHSGTEPFRKGYKTQPRLPDILRALQTFFAITEWRNFSPYYLRGWLLPKK